MFHLLLFKKSGIVSHNHLVFQLLHGVDCHAYSDEELLKEIGRFVEDGYTKVKFKVGAAGGISRDLERLRKVREAFGPGLEIMLDANNCWDAATAIRFADRAKEYDIAFLEEPVFADDIILSE